MASSPALLLMSAMNLDVNLKETPFTLDSDDCLA